MFEFMALVNMLMLGVHPHARVDNTNRREQFFMGVLYPNGDGGRFGDIVDFTGNNAKTFYDVLIFIIYLEYKWNSLASHRPQIVTSWIVTYDLSWQYWTFNNYSNDSVSKN